MESPVQDPWHSSLSNGGLVGQTPHRLGSPPANRKDYANGLYPKAELKNGTNGHGTTPLPAVVAPLSGGNGLITKAPVLDKNNSGVTGELLPSGGGNGMVVNVNNSCCAMSDRQCPNYEDDEVDGGREYVCGLWSIRPKWLQPFANKKAFLAVFCLTSVLQGMYYTYFVSVLTTIEKLYQIQSKTTGIIMSATEIGQIGGALLLTYYGGQGHRPRWIACGMLVFAFASILCSTPHFFLGGEVLLPKARGHENMTLIDLESKLCHRNEAIAAVKKTRAGRLVLDPPFLARTDADLFFNESAGDALNGSSSVTLEDAMTRWTGGGMTPEADALRSRRNCDAEGKPSQQGQLTHTVLAVFFVSLLFIGIGATTVNTLGIPYIDDNVATRESPLYFGITIGVRIFGPVFGFLLGSFCTGVYVNFPFEEVPLGLSTDNPQWIGAWWLGVFIVGAALILTAFPMMAFPRNLPNQPDSRCQSPHHHRIPGPPRPCERHFSHSPPPPVGVHDPGPLAIINGPYPNTLDIFKSPEGEALLVNGHVPAKIKSTTLADLNLHSKCQHVVRRRNNQKPSLKNFPAAMRRLLKNDILLCRTASSVLHILPIAGLYTFLPKFLESQFQLTATKANMISGMAGILVMGAGIFASGVFMRSFKPNARFVARWIALCALFYAIGMVILMWLGCPMNNYVGLNSTSGSIRPTNDVCNGTCHCKFGEFSPICTSDGVTYLSPCMAGCTKVEGSPTKQYTFSECLCLEPQVTATNGYCPLQCDNLVWYTIIFSFFVLVHSTSEVGSMLLTLRCVDPQDKAMALGLISFAIGLFGNVPCPIIYGAIVDSACLFWEDNCGQPGACRVYDPVRFRMVFHGVTAVIMFAAFVVDAIIWYKSSTISFHVDEHPAPPAYGGQDEEDAERQPMNEKQSDDFETTV